MNKKSAFLLALLMTSLIALNIYFFSNNSPARKTVFVDEVIDGDTISINGERARLLNINTPEKSEKGYEEAKEFLYQIENKTIEVEEISTDQYGRILIRAYAPEYLNLEIVERGLATKFLVQESETSLFEKAESNAVKNQKGLWEISPLANCFKIDLFYKEEIVKIKNSCQNVSAKDFTIRDESRKRYKFPNIIFYEINLNTIKGKDNETDLFWNLGTSVWNNDRDTLYFLDDKDRLVSRFSYGY